MIDLEKRIESAMELYCNNKDAMHVPPRDTDIDVVLSDCLKEITKLKQKLEKLESGEFVLVPRELNGNIIEDMWSTFDKRPDMQLIHNAMLEAVEKEHAQQDS